MTGNKWDWVLRRLKDNQQVCRWVWQTRYVYKAPDGSIQTSDGKPLNIDDYEASDWGPNTKLKDLKVGQKWRLTMSPEMPPRMMVSEPYGYGVKWLWYVELSTGKLHRSNPDDLSHVTILS